MTDRKPLLMDTCEFLAQKSGDNLPHHAFTIGDGGTAHLGQFPNLRLLTLYAIGKGPVPLPGGDVDTLGMGPFALGQLIGDAVLKLLRPWEFERGEADVASMVPINELSSVIDLMLPISPKAAATRESFLCRMGEFIDIALLQPERLPAIITNIDTLTNARLTERARAILTTGIDSGGDDLWRMTLPADQGGDHAAN